jgi:propanol-preferring alcohol dehydrogenase
MSSETMRAMVLDQPASGLRLTDVPVPEPGLGQVLLRVHACGVCRTDLHVIDGELAPQRSPLIPGHQIVGSVVQRGEAAHRFPLGARVGGYAEYTVADERYCYPIPDAYTDTLAAPLLCAGLIGYRCLRLAGPAERLGLYGFGAAAHIAVQVARHRGQRVFAFVRAGDVGAERFAREMGAEWAGDSSRPGPEELDAAIIFAPAGELVPAALRAIRPGGVVVCGGIHMSDIPRFPYAALWGERVLRSVANLTREDGEEFLALAPKVPVRTEVETHPLEDAMTALARLRAGEVHGAAVLVPPRES